MTVQKLSFNATHPSRIQQVSNDATIVEYKKRTWTSSLQ